ncbi:UNVERIFIED_CONTAM: hypothetical protein FKN15_060072 [Acipenser sinensis]
MEFVCNDTDHCLQRPLYIQILTSVAPFPILPSCHDKAAASNHRSSARLRCTREPPELRGAALYYRTTGAPRGCTAQENHRSSARLRCTIEPPELREAALHKRTTGAALYYRTTGALRFFFYNS